MNKIKYIKGVKVIDDRVVKQRKIDIEKTYSYLDNRDFNNYLKPIEVNDKEEIYEYIVEDNIEDEDKSIDLIYLLSILHNKTTRFTNKNIDDVKKLYEDTVKLIDDTYNYYFNLQEELEEHIYMAPAERLLMYNISKIYFMLNSARYYIEEYYKKTENISNIRKAQIHGNPRLSHIIEKDNKYLISWNKSRVDLPVYDLITFYKKEFNNINFSSLYKIYQSKYTYTKEESCLFLSLINIPDIVLLNKDNYTNTIRIRRLVDYIDTTINFTLEENKEDQESDQ